MATVLVAEDRTNNLELLEDILRHMGHCVKVATNAKEAMARLANCTPELIISDMHMPGGDGFELIAELQKQPSTSQIPLILVTGAYTNSDVIGAIALMQRRGAARPNILGVMQKPFDVEQLIETVKLVLDRTGNDTGDNSC